MVKQMMSEALKLKNKSGDKENLAEKIVSKTFREFAHAYKHLWSTVFILASTGISRSTKQGSIFTVHRLSKLYILDLYSKIIEGPSENLCSQMSKTSL